MGSLRGECEPRTCCTSGGPGRSTQARASVSYASTTCGAGPGSVGGLPDGASIEGHGGA
jgi:hypothetical protein